MNLDFTLGPNNLIYKTNNYFPKLDKGRKMGVFLSGGMESTLISIISQNIYGKDRVINFYSDNIFSANDQLRNSYIVGNVKRSADLLKVEPVYLDFNYDLHLSDRKKSIENKILSLKKDYDVDFVMFGFTKLFFEVEVFKQEGITEEQVRNIAFSNTEKFKSTIEEFHLETDQYTWHLLDIDIPSEVYHLLREGAGFIKSPFKDLNKCEVVDLYHHLDKLDILYGTSSCIMESLTKVGKHCGECFNCQQRYDAFRILGKGIEDKTDYAKDDIVHRRDKLEKIRNA
jgi:hypothetical protein